MTSYVYKFISKDEKKMLINPYNAHKTIEDIFGSEESRITIEGKYQHRFNLDDSIEKILNMKWLW